jgi:hypothetical protein
MEQLSNIRIQAPAGAVRRADANGRLAPAAPDPDRWADKGVLKMMAQTVCGRRWRNR